MPKKCSAHQCDHDELFNQLLAQIFHSTIDQLATVVGSDQLDPGRQAFFQRFKLGFDVKPKSVGMQDGPSQLPVFVGWGLS